MGRETTETRGEKGGGADDMVASERGGVGWVRARDTSQSETLGSGSADEREEDRSGKRGVIEELFRGVVVQ